MIPVFRRTVIRTGMTIPPEEMATIYEYIGTRSMWDMLEEL